MVVPMQSIVISGGIYRNKRYVDGSLLLLRHLSTGSSCCCSCCSCRTTATNDRNRHQFRSISTLTTLTTTTTTTTAFQPQQQQRLLPTCYNNIIGSNNSSSSTVSSIVTGSYNTGRRSTVAGRPQQQKQRRNQHHYRYLSSSSSSSSSSSQSSSQSQLFESSIFASVSSKSSSSPSPEDDDDDDNDDNNDDDDDDDDNNNSNKRTTGRYEDESLLPGHLDQSEMIEYLFADQGQQSSSQYRPRRPSKKAPKRTALYDFHKDIGCTFTVHDDYEIPFYYRHSQGGIKKEHDWCRTPGCASIFDISHLTQYRIFGKDRVHFLERLVTADLKGLPMDHATFTCLTNDVEPIPSPPNHNHNHNPSMRINDISGNIRPPPPIPSTMNIIDTGIVSQCDDNLYLVTNGDPILKSRLWDHLQHYMNVAVEMNVNPDRVIDKNIAEEDYEYIVYLYTLEKSHSLLSIQGSGAAAALQSFIPSSVQLQNLSYMQGIRTSVMDCESCRITRCGYTGLDGFELSIPHAAVEEFMIEILESNPSTLNVAGLGARNILRMESGMLQYGVDIHPMENSMIETGYNTKSMIHPRRIQEGNFLGADHIRGQLVHSDKNNTTTTTSNNNSNSKTNPDLSKHSKLRFVGIIGMDRIATANAVIYDGSTGTIPIGHVTSGVYSPTLRKHIAMGYVLEDYQNIDTPIQVEMTYNHGRKKRRMNATITKMPFVPTTYYRYDGPSNVEKEEERQPIYDTIPANMRPDYIEPYYEKGRNGIGGFNMNKKRNKDDEVDDGGLDPLDLIDTYTNDDDNHDEFLQYSAYYSSDDESDAEKTTSNKNIER